MTIQIDGRPLICNGEKSLLLSRVSDSDSMYRGKRGEKTLQKLLAENPSMLPIRELEPLWAGACCVARELQTDAGQVDLLLVNAQGRLSIVETKLFKNPESRREVLAQVLDYAAAIHNMSYEKLGNAIRRKNPELAQETDPLLAMVKLNCPMGEDIDEEAFHDRVCTDLEVGQFLILIVGEGIKKELRTLVDYFEKVSHLGFKVGLISVEQWQSENSDIVLVPKVIGSIERDVRVWTPDPNSTVAQEIAKAETESTKPSSSRKRLKLSEIDAIKGFRSSIAMLENGATLLKSIDLLSEKCAKIGLTEEHPRSGASRIWYYDEPKFEGMLGFNLLQCSKTGSIEGTNFLQYRCSPDVTGLPDKIWIDHWTKLGKISNAGTLVKSPTPKSRNQHKFLDKDSKPPKISDVFGVNGEHVEAIAHLLEDTANAIMEASEALNDS